MAKEQVTLYGLPIVRDRRVHFGAIDPKASRRIFLLHALVRGEYASDAPYVAQNRALFEEVRRLRDRARRSDMLADDDAVALFFEQRVPDTVYSGKTFERLAGPSGRGAGEPAECSACPSATCCSGRERRDLSPARLPGADE